MLSSVYDWARHSHKLAQYVHDYGKLQGETAVYKQCLNSRICSHFLYTALSAVKLLQEQVGEGISGCIIQIFTHGFGIKRRADNWRKTFGRIGCSIL